MRHLLIVLASLCALNSAPASAGTFGYIGYGAQNQSLGNSTVAKPTDGFSQAYNPALMAVQDKSTFSLALEGAVTSFSPISQVLVDTPGLGGSANTVADLNMGTRDTFVAAIGYQAALNSQAEWPIHLGLNIVTPIQRVFEIDTPDMFQPQYSMYLSDTQRLVPGVTLSKRVLDKLAVGLGLNMFMVQGSNSRNRLPAGGESTARLGTEIKTGYAPMVGLLYDLNEQWRLGLNYRGRQDYQSEIDIDTQLSIIGPTDLIFTGRTSIAYDPDMIILGACRTTDLETISFSAKYERWVGYTGGAMNLTFSTFTGSFSQYVPPTPFHDIVSLHGGFEHRYPSNRLRFGYSYVPTPVPDQSGETNILDSDKHEFYAGYGWKWDHTPLLDGVFRLDIVGFYDYLVPKKITKVSNQYIGAPGYNIGGSIFGYGVTGTREF